MKNMMKGTLNFMRKNIYYILLIICVAAIAAVIFATAYNNSPIDDLPTGGNNQIQDPPDETPEPIIMSFELPVKVGTIGMDYSTSEPVYNQTMRRLEMHKGIDFIADVGTSVYAVYDGEVESVSYDTLFGTTIVIKHDEDVRTIYKLLEESTNVKVGDRIRTGDIIGTVGLAYFEVSEGAHLHFEVTKLDENVNPYDYFLNSEK